MQEKLGNSKIPVEIKAKIEGDLAKLYLIFSIDNGNSWYEVMMIKNPPYYQVSIPNLSPGVKILYLFKAISSDGEEYIENNSGQYFCQVAGQSSIQEYTGKEAKKYNLEIEEEEKINNVFDLEEKNQKNLIEEKKQEIPFIVPNLNNSEEIGSKSDENTKFVVKNEIFFPEEKEEDKINQNGSITPKGITPKPLDSSVLPPEFSNSNSNQPELFDVEPSQNLNNQKLKMKPNFQAKAYNINNPNEETKFISQPKIKTPIVGNDKYARPIIPYNPFDVDSGEILKSANALQSFSQLIGAKITELPSKKHSFIQRPNLYNTKRCDNCNAVMQDKWKICAICGNKN